ncbi:unnamed protein product [Bursaphelenchus okinawaensis]|uniref:Hydroxylysine kinase n=1 Tax=Bursaphelenchus okinawaensis TaxID=465554 RepID=A0A811JZI3_9BILA|nr:unnamed protein product [Bursaphelenchus okinawaensis]CAG9088256.1 unnamed protein product [Bursaphelenchus okinawaensis]
MESQINLMSFLRSNGIPCPRVIKNKFDENFAVVEMCKNVSLPVRVFEFMEGETLESVGFTQEAASIVGDLLAKFHNVTDNFQDDVIKKHGVPIAIENYQGLLRELHLLFGKNMIDNENSQICTDVLKKLEIEIFRNYDFFEYGLIHSDLNETNVLLIKEGDNTLKVSSLLDFGDTHYSLRLFDISSTLLYIYLGIHSQNVKNMKNLANAFLTAYKKQRKNNSFIKEIKHCQLAMCARLICSLLYGLRTVRINYRGDDPSYVLKTQANGWTLLKFLSTENLDLPSTIRT